jgi:histidinol dehydrogenase
VSLFHESQAPTPARVETSPGVVCERIIVPLEAVGLYVPAGTAPLPSTAIMLAVPARIAGCGTRVMCTPPRPDGTADPAVLVAARRCGIDQVFKVGGAQAVAAMAYGTQSVPKVSKIFGPGNSWVTAAKQIVRRTPMGCTRHACRALRGAGHRRRRRAASVCGGRPDRAGGTQHRRAGCPRDDVARAG